MNKLANDIRGHVYRYLTSMGETSASMDSVLIFIGDEDEAKVGRVAHDLERLYSDRRFNVKTKTDLDTARGTVSLTVTIHT